MVRARTPSSAELPEAPRRSIRMIAGHVHNARCMWIRTLGAPHGVPIPAPVDRHRVGATRLLSALRRSGGGIERLLQLGLDHDGVIPVTRSYQWRNLPLDVGHVLGYFVAHEAHHRGQIVLAARAAGHRLPADVTAGLWQWSRLGLARGKHWTAAGCRNRTSGRILWNTIGPPGHRSAAPEENPAVPGPTGETPPPRRASAPSRPSPVEVDSREDACNVIPSALRPQAKVV